MRTPLLLGLALTLALLTGAAAFSAPVQAQTTPSGIQLVATLTGGAEIPGPGDADGFGFALIDVLSDNRLCFLLFVQGIEPATLAHIHVGPPTVAGPIVVNLIAPASGISQGCVPVAPGLLLEIVSNPSNYYVNVHNIPFPMGAVRGQLARTR